MAVTNIAGVNFVGTPPVARLPAALRPVAEDSRPLAVASQALAASGTALTLTPATGTLLSDDVWYWVVKGYRVRFTRATTLLALDVRLSLAAGACVRAIVYDVATQAEVANGSTVCGGSGDTYYRSDVSFSAEANHEYVLAFYVPKRNTFFPRQEDPSFPYTVNGLVEVLESRSNSLDTNDPSFPDASNSWAPHMRVYIDEGATVSPSSVAFGNQRVGVTSTTRAVTLSNGGAASLSVTALNVTGPFSTSGLDLPATVAPGSSTTFQVAFSPTATGAATGQVVVVSDASNGNQVVSLSGTGVQPGMSVSPSSVDFGNVRVGTASAARSVTVSNTGSDTLTLSGASASGPFSISGLSLPATVAPGASLSFDVTFASTATGAASGSLSLTSDAPGSPFSLTLSGKGVASFIAANPNPLSFGAISLGQSDVATLTLSNTGDAPLTLSALGFTGEQAEDFSLEGAPTLPLAVAPGGSQELRVRFTPGNHGARRTTLEVTSDASGAGTLRVPVDGEGIGPRLAVTPASLDLGSTNVGHTSASRSVTVSNTGETDLVLSAVSFSGAAAADFATPASMPMTLVPGTSASIAFSFTPSEVGARAARATFVTNDTLAAGAEVALAGVGTSPLLELSAASFDFGDVRVGTSSAGQTLTVKNTGTGPLTLASASLAGTGASRFSLAPDTFPLSIPAGGSSSFTVTFHPDRVGTASAELTLLSDDAARPNVVIPLTGTGISSSLSLSATALDFGAQPVGRTSSPRGLSVKNAGSGSLTVSSVKVEGSGAAAFSLVGVPALPLVLAPGQTASFQVTMTVEEAGVREATVLIESDDLESPRAQVSVRGTGVSQALSASPAEVAFGTFRLPAASGPRSVVITNLTAETLELAEPEVTGTHASHFQVSGVAGPLGPGASVTASVVYTTAAAADSSATLRISTRDGKVPALTVALSGRAVSKLVKTDPTSLDFGQVTEGETGAVQSVTVTNLSTEPVTVSEVRSDGEAFIVEASGLSTLAPGASGTFTVTFAPKSAGAANALVRVTLRNATEPEAVVAVSGIGRARDVDGGESGCGCGQGAGGSPWPAGLMLALCLGWLGLARRRGV
ncbi:choice-of-anchor D domain-containing protein [Vitiosangium sp. GDMCC 1.1324]|uniref:choice-of-anchor D domain-containing protein n=1 Tax=Vitiosangium sp. (strain GDMCC 1.1324) TaxID=2138576 RepID=UPI00130DBBB1|nr:choice-of-anchor D domain-containing protein [Vitiosangium sp. GDMCC 1.1324]